MSEQLGTPIPADQAWRTFSDWKGDSRPIGIIYYGASGTSLYSMGVIQSARNGRVEIKGEMLRATFNLTGATFAHGPVQTWPKWPSPPIVEVLAVQVQLENGDWLALADGLRPDSLAPRGIAQ